MSITKTDVVEVLDPIVQTAWHGIAESGVGQLTTGYVLCSAILGLSRSGMAERLSRDWSPLASVVPIGADTALAEHLLRYLEVRGVLETADGAWRLTERGASLLGDVAESLVGYYVEAYGPVFQRVGQLVTRIETYGVDVERDTEALGRRCEVLFRSFGTNLVRELAREHSATAVLDLGCGTGGLVLDLCRDDPELRGVGLDIASDAIALARHRATDAGLAARATFVVADAFAPESWPDATAACDFYVAVGALHERFRDGRDAVVQLLRRYRTMLEGDKVLLLCEPELNIDAADAEFYLLHALTAQGFPQSRAHWLEVIELAGLRCRRMFTAPNTGFRFCYYELTA